MPPPPPWSKARATRPVGRSYARSASMATVFSKDLLFLHVPKTGGGSVPDYLLGVLPRPFYYVRPKQFRRQLGDGVHWLPGRGHWTLAEAADLVKEHGFDVTSLPLILAVLRNPYDLAVSLYGFLRRPNNPTAAENPL